MRVRVIELIAMTVVVAAACQRGDTRARDDSAARRLGSADSAEATAAVSPETGAVPSAGRHTILFVGTSLTAGYGLDPAQAYPALIQRRVDSVGVSYRVLNRGVSGETSADLLDRIDWLLRQRDNRLGAGDVIVIETGANDGLRGLSADSMRANIQAVLDHVRASAPSARVFLVQMEAPPNFGPRYTSDFRRVFPELAAKNGVALMPFLLDGVAGKPALNQGDGIHPNVTGERIVADNVWRAIKPVLVAARR